MKGIILVCGGSCSGKTAFAGKLYEALAALGSTEYISMDDYYRDVSHLSEAELENYNFDVPEAIDSELLFEHLRKLASGTPVPRQQYDFKSHAVSVVPQLICPADYTVVEGIFAFYFEQMRNIASAKIFIRLDADLRLIRRIRRDRVERGLDAEFIVTQYLEAVRPMHELFVAPYEKFADLTLDGRYNFGNNIDIAIEHLTGEPV